MNQPEKSLPRLVSSVGARNILGLHPRTFDRLHRAGVFRRVGGALEAASLQENYAQAIAIEAEAKARIEEIQNETRRRLAAIGAGLEKWLGTAAELSPRRFPYPEASSAA